MTPEHEYRAFISPDGERVAFVRMWDMNSELFMIPTSGGTAEKIADGVTTLFS